MYLVVFALVAHVAVCLGLRTFGFIVGLSFGSPVVEPSHWHVVSSRASYWHVDGSWKFINRTWLDTKFTPCIAVEECWRNR